MAGPYLETLERRLAAGVSRLGRDFARRQVEYVLTQQVPGGGFRGRAGGADTYYTDFALRTLVLLGHPEEPLGRAARFIEGITTPPATVVEWFNRLNCARLLANAGAAVEIDATAWRPPAAGAGGSAYDFFLAALCHEMLGMEFPELGRTAEAVSALRCADGGFCGSRAPGIEQAGQANATAAAVVVLMMNGALEQAEAMAAAAFLASLQASEGGFVAHRAAPEADLLSTFTALVSLAELDSLGRVNLGAAGRFLRSVACPDGGFRACLSDRQPDVEYTYYGVAAAALLAGHLESIRSGAQ